MKERSMGIKKEVDSQQDSAYASGSGCLLAILGLVVGVATYFYVLDYTPMEAKAFRIPQGVDDEQVAIALAKWKRSCTVVLWQVASILAPLLASSLCGLILHISLPASIPSALLRTVGVTLSLAAVSYLGVWIIDRTLSTGESSDLGTPLIMMAFQALCFALAAPLTSRVIRRRPRRSKAPVPDFDLE
jgi:hypothetical protein